MPSSTAEDHCSKGRCCYGIEKRCFDGKKQVPCKTVKHLTFQYEDYEVPEGFDTSKSTTENYRACDREVLGDYADIRAQLDFDYHGNYTRKRQLFQDTLLHNVVGAGTEVWLSVTF